MARNITENIMGDTGKTKHPVIINIVVILLITAGIVASSIAIIRMAGKASLMEKAQSSYPVLIQREEIPVSVREQEEWQENWVRYKGRIYAYNEDIITFLIMGIDKEAGQETEGNMDGGQADALFLAVMNPHDQTIKVIGINRNTMTDIDIYDEEGEFVTTTKAQIAVQHGFGDGKEQSCEYQKKAVSQLFYGLPIHGYAALNLDAITTINDAVGGVEVTVLEDLTEKDASLVEGQSVHLMGESAFWYVKYRNASKFASADLRLLRQKQYLSAFIDKAKVTAKKNITVAIDLYQAVKPAMTTDITLDEVAYLAPILVDYQFDMSNLFLLEGETVMGEHYEEFHVDEDALYELILNIFYEEVAGQPETGIAYETASDAEIDFDVLQSENEDIFAWIYIPGTEIDCPVLQSFVADDYYEEHDAYGYRSKTGAVYAELANMQNMCDFMTVFHGKDEEGNLEGLYQYFDSRFFEDHGEIQVYLEDNLLTYEVFAVYERENTNLLRSYDFSYTSGCEQFLKDLYGTRGMTKIIREGWEDVSPYHFLLTLTAESKTQKDRQIVVIAALMRDPAGTIKRVVLE